MFIIKAGVPDPGQHESTTFPTPEIFSKVPALSWISPPTAKTRAN